MCSNLEEDIPVVSSKIKLDQLQFCKKCKGETFVVIQRKDVFCRECFYEYCTHKFRSTIGKSRKVRPGDRVLIAYSGGASSSAMLDMIEDGLTKPNDHKKLLFSPTILFIRELNYLNEDDRVIRSKERIILERLSASKLPVLISSIEMFYQDKDKPIYYKDLTSDQAQHKLINCDTCRSKLLDKINSVTTDTGKEDLLRLIRRQLIQQIASLTDFKYIFVGDTCTKTAIQMLADLSQGKGSQITPEHSFIDDRFNVAILKPMREFIKKEVTYWNILKGIEPVEWSTITTTKTVKASLMKLTESYINALELDFPATVYTIFKTGNKLKSSDPNGTKCKMCHSLIDPEQKCSASNALRLSHKLSKDLTTKDEDKQSDRNLCYSCKNLVNEMKFVDGADSLPSRLGIDSFLL